MLASCFSCFVFFRLLVSCSSHRSICRSVIVVMIVFVVFSFVTVPNSTTTFCFARQAATASVIAILGTCVLQEARPYRKHSDNEVAVAAQYCAFAWFFSIVLRYAGISDRKTLAVMGTLLIAATLAVFGFALWRVSTEVKLLRAERQASFTEDLPTAVDRDCAEDSSDGEQDESPPRETRSAGESPRQDIEMTTITTTTGNRRNPLPTTPGRMTSTWHIQLLSLCTAESELGDALADEQRQSSSDDIAGLQRKLAEQSKLIGEKDAEIARLLANATVH